MPSACSSNATERRFLFEHIEGAVAKWQRLQHSTIGAVCHQHAPDIRLDLHQPTARGSIFAINSAFPYARCVNRFGGADGAVLAEVEGALIAISGEQVACKQKRDGTDDGCLLCPMTLHGFPDGRG